MLLCPSQRKTSVIGMPWARLAEAQQCRSSGACADLPLAGAAIPGTRPEASAAGLAGPRQLGGQS